ncbi:hypothetical protein, partial [Myxosarcina sp. GI1]|uniref:hypothetical protein n=1 Tax=Myxosarcina sp. GI1 TaxID=1541065 RepID=UPI0012E00A18
MVTLQQQLSQISLDKPEDIPKIVRLLENPQSPIALPGAISLYNHDCLHVLLKQKNSPEEEAFIVGFCMGNDPATKRIHVFILKLSARYVYPKNPKNYRFTKKCLLEFDRGFNYGKTFEEIRFNRIDFFRFANNSVDKLQDYFGISRQDLLQLRLERVLETKARSEKTRIIPKQTRLKRSINFFKWSSSICALVGGGLLASNISYSKFGFVGLAMSSSQLLVASLLA